MKRAALFALLVLGTIIGLGIGYLVWSSPRYELSGDARAVHILDTRTKEVWVAVGNRPIQFCGVLEKPPKKPKEQEPSNPQYRTLREELDQLRREGYTRPAAAASGGKKGEKP